MRISILFISLCVTAATVFGAEDGAELRARQELARVQELVVSGVLPRARLEQALDALIDVREDAIIRNSLFEKDITVSEADGLVDLTAKRVERRQKLFDERKKFLDDGIIAKSELEETKGALDRANQEHGWAVTRARMARDMLELVRGELEAMRQMEEAASRGASSGKVEHFAGSSRFEMSQFAGIERAFQARFAHPLPVSAMGETEVHRSLGFDHRNRVDVALQPDLPEGQWLRKYLTSHNISYFAFRSAVARKATGAHIHIGPASGRLVAQANPKRSTKGSD